MIVVTGGAGFIGSNLHAALVARGHETVVVDRLGDASPGKWRNLRRHPPAQLVAPDALDAFLAGSPRPDMIFHLGAISSTTAQDGDAVWRDQRRPVRPAVGVLRRARRAPGLRLLGRDLWRRRREGFDDDPNRLDRAAAAQPVWLEQARVRPAGGPRDRLRRAAAAAMGRAEILQRLWPQRVPQGRRWSRWSRSSTTRSPPASARRCSARTARTCPTAGSSAISSGWATWWT